LNSIIIILKKLIIYNLGSLIIILLLFYLLELFTNGLTTWVLYFNLEKWPRSFIPFVYQIKKLRSIKAEWFERWTKYQQNMSFISLSHTIACDLSYTAHPLLCYQFTTQHQIFFLHLWIKFGEVYFSYLKLNGNFNDRKCSQKKYACTFHVAVPNAFMR
jgi:hypothetical protein